LGELKLSLSEPESLGTLTWEGRVQDLNLENFGGCDWQGHGIWRRAIKTATFLRKGSVDWEQQLGAWNELTP